MTPGAIYACVDQTVPLSASASDLDKWETLFDFGLEEDDIASITWTAGGGSVDNSSHEWTAPANPGQYTLTCTVDDVGGPVPSGDLGSRNDTPASVMLPGYVIGGPFTASTHELRYYCGGYVPGKYKATLTATSGQPDGTTYNWAVCGPGEIESGQGTSTAVLMASHESGPDGIWVVLTYSLDGHDCQTDPLYFTGAAPYHYIFVSYTEIPNPGGYTGYETDAKYLIRDNLWREMDDVCIGETFDDDRYDSYWPNNWSTVSEEGECGVGPYVYDRMFYRGPWNPQPLPYPQQNAPAIYDHTQHIWVGGTVGTGCEKKVTRQAFYLDRARHE